MAALRWVVALPAVLSQLCDVPTATRTAWTTGASAQLTAAGYEVGSVARARGEATTRARRARAPARPPASLRQVAHGYWQFAPIGTISDPDGTYGAVILPEEGRFPPDAADFCAADAPLVFDTDAATRKAIEPNDIRQGALGDCWFLSSLSVLATRPSLVKRLIVSDTNAKKYGIYTVKFSKAGVWR